MHTADVVPVNSVEEWFGNALNLELKKAGYEVIQDVNAISGGGAPILSGDIQNVYSSALFRYDATVTFFIKLTKDNY